MKEKKRKRSEDTNLEPSAKRVAVESSAKTIKVSFAAGNDEWAPILGVYILDRAHDSIGFISKLLDIYCYQ